jgi:DNA-binding response OmpR family regulator
MAGESILIVEDERAVARGLEYGLSKEGFKTYCVYTGQSAWRHPDVPLDPLAISD